MICEGTIDLCFRILTNKNSNFFYLDPAALLSGKDPIFVQSESRKVHMTSNPKLPKSFENVQIAQDQILLFPANFYSGHWYLVVAHLESSSITSFDSLDIDRTDILEEIGNFLKFWMKTPDVTFECVKGRCPRQIKNSNDCAAHVIVNAQMLIHSDALATSQGVIEHHYESSDLIRGEVLKLLNEN